MNDAHLHDNVSELVTSVLERDQLSGAVKQPVPRKRLSRVQLAVVWSLRIYLLFMIAVVIYQVWTAAR